MLFSNVKTMININYAPDFLNAQRRINEQGISSICTSHTHMSVNE